MAGKVVELIGVIEEIGKDVPAYTNKDGHIVTRRRLILNTDPNGQYPKYFSVDTKVSGFLNTSAKLDEFELGQIVKVSCWLSGSSKLFKDKNDENNAYVSLDLKEIDLYGTQNLAVDKTPKPEKPQKAEQPESPPDDQDLPF
jgi:hypothetical protein